MENSAVLWVKDEQGDRYLCPLEATEDFHKVKEEYKDNCIDSARISGEPYSRPGHIRA